VDLQTGIEPVPKTQGTVFQNVRCKKYGFRFRYSVHTNARSKGRFQKFGVQMRTTRCVVVGAELCQCVPRLKLRPSLHRQRALLVRVGRGSAGGCD
jgi:hypothetical protein